MKLSEKLAAVEQQAAVKKVATRKPVAPKQAQEPAGTRPARRASDAAAWEESKRKVRDHVLIDVAPRISGKTGDELAEEVRAAVDKALRREDVRVSPLERRSFVEDVIRDILGYGPLDPLLADPTITEIMCNGHDEIWVERAGRIEPTTSVFGD